MIKKITQKKIMPLTLEQFQEIQSIFMHLSNDQLIWISGYLWGLTHSAEFEKITNISKDTDVISDKNVHVDPQITLISASQTGNARRLAECLRDDIIAANLKVILFNAKDYKFKKLSKETLLIIIISTYGEGEPPEEAIALYQYLFSNKAPNMINTNFAIFGFGDRSYEHFAKAGKDFDYRLEELGAKRLLNRVDVDVDFKKEADIWRKNIVSLLKSKMHVNNIFCNTTQHINTSKLIHTTTYNKMSPFVAHLLTRQKISSRNALKDVFHLEIDISNSDINYQPGDTLGVWHENDPNLVDELLNLLNLNGNDHVSMQKQIIPLNTALKKYYELMQNTPILIKEVANISQNKTLINLLKDKEKLYEFIANTPIIEMIYRVPLILTPQQLLKILCPIKPRFYSISSAQAEVGEEIHITVSVIRYEINGHFRTGSASSYLADRIQENDKIRIFVESNDNFRLPTNSNAPIIMIGAGTGIAPFRAFMQQRSIDGSAGKNWLFFGNQKFIDDFLYQLEWQNYFKNKLLTNINTAWSRDQDHKIYIQNELLINGDEIWKWIEEGAYVYVCGNAKYMAQDVDKALIKLVSQHGNMDINKSKNFWNKMRVEHRYQRDIY
ncbi:NADPH-dependent assimilatory sulfite reductase flavoprotein subunit [Candidatus Blochmannia ocreatus (nom. nud.)]|uniref:Sulfite reductase [NADPH] flavoprotein alpha-component n=1 Tax=Candidatus Blochmannia ocreatus (nom. nud.) TaxID=251538 RepID=A0ABY4SWB3_9ENTR|nr:NADPH-dependent assimilatory sulfite reductase flavoprotein subunit [Candidatus Blochmannia ocreatus]URJ25240.1 NADPH-dependent assimilatory sulfite reductase flavoprotein subunit [Candidatus Blochmannia ocreatus]